jgi:hypothetical protein
MKNYEFESIKNKFLDIYTAICDLTDDKILNGPEHIFRSHFERLQRLMARLGPVDITVAYPAVGSSF